MLIAICFVLRLCAHTHPYTSNLHPVFCRTVWGYRYTSSARRSDQQPCTQSVVTWSWGSRIESSPSYNRKIIGCGWSSPGFVRTPDQIMTRVQVLTSSPAPGVAGSARAALLPRGARLPGSARVLLSYRISRFSLPGSAPRVRFFPTTSCTAPVRRPRSLLGPRVRPPSPSPRALPPPPPALRSPAAAALRLSATSLLTIRRRRRRRGWSSSPPPPREPGRRPSARREQRPERRTETMLQPPSDICAAMQSRPRWEQRGERSRPAKRSSSGTQNRASLGHHCIKSITNNTIQLPIPLTVGCHDCY